MKKIIIKEIEIDNFKGIKHYKREFDVENTKIYASNGAGKTSIKNAWEWVLYQQVDDYIPKFNNKEVENLTTSVQVKIGVNNYDYILKRTSQGKYRNGVKQSNENTCEIDGISLQPKQYQAQIAGIFGVNDFSELIMLTDKEFFNSDTTKWKWSDRRKLLLTMCNVDEATKDIQNKPEYDCIKEYIVKGYPTSDIKSMFLKERNALKKEQEKNAILIEQKQTELNEYLGIDFDKLSSELGKAKTQLTKTLNASRKEQQTDILVKLQDEILDYTKQLTNLRVKDEIKKSEISSERIKVHEKAIQTDSEYKKTYNEIMLLKDKMNTNIYCPNCGECIHTEEQDNINTSISEKEKTLEFIRENYNELYAKYMKLTEELENFKENICIRELETLISKAKTSLEEAKSRNLNKLSQDKQTELQDKIKSLELELSKKDLIVKGEKQIKEWKLASMDVADKLVQLDKKDKALQDFIKEQTDIINQTVNQHFHNGISWSLYNENYNGSLDEECVCLYNGKRYSSLSTGERNVADFEVLTALQKYYDSQIPIWVDNAETITLAYSTDGQVIELYAKAGNGLDSCEKIGG